MTEMIGLQTVLKVFIISLINMLKDGKESLNMMWRKMKDKMRKTDIELLEMKNTTSNEKDTGINRRLDTMGEG